jgi:omega-3 fatty acid desaturase (delta-15 desaturase)
MTETAVAATTTASTEPNDNVAQRIAQIPSIKEIKQSLPPKVFVSHLPTSLYYVAKDITLVLLLYIGMKYVERNYSSFAPLVFPLYWFLQGTMFWAIFVLGHDAGMCVHYSFQMSARVSHPSI